MISEIDKLKLKIRNTLHLRRTQLTFSLDEARALENEIKVLEERIAKLELEVLKPKTLTIDIMGREF